MKIAVGCDEAAYELKMAILDFLKENGYETEDFGAQKGENVLYPDVAYRVAEEIARGNYERGILLCGTGIGMSICANKVPGVRAAVCHDPFSAQRARMSNNAQIMCLGERVVGPELAKCLVGIWLVSEFAGGRSVPKVERITELEQKYRVI